MEKLRIAPILMVLCSGLTGVVSLCLPSHALASIGQVVVYVAPMYGTSGGALTPTDVATKFDTLLYARNQMNGNLPQDKAAGFNGNAMVYLVTNELYGPPGLTSVASQSTPCTASQSQFSVNSNNVAMDTGDFCKIHDAIVNHTALAEYPDIYPTENWFLHTSDGSRIAKTSGSATLYHPNPGDPNWRKFFARRALRELVTTEPNHPAIAGATGLFVDNLELSTGDVKNAAGGPLPSGYSTDASYMSAIIGFIQYVHTALHTGSYSFPVWANMISDTNTGTSWNQFAPYLEGGMNESFGLSWGNGPSSQTTTINQLTEAEYWISQGKHFIAVAQGDSQQSYHLYALGLFLLVSDVNHASFKYANHSGSYNQYYELPEYYLALGTPVGAKQLVTSSPLVYKRQFTCGVVSVDLTGHIASVTKNAPCGTSLPGDFNGDGKVDIFDYNVLVANFGHPYTIFDYNTLVANFGK